MDRSHSLYIVVHVQTTLMYYINFQKVRMLFIRTLNVRTKKFGQFLRISDKIKKHKIFRTKLKNTKYFGQVHFYYI